MLAFLPSAGTSVQVIPLCVISRGQCSHFSFLGWDPALAVPLSVWPRGGGGAAESQVGRGAVGGVLAPSCTAVPVAVGLHSNTERELLRTAGAPQATAC